MKRLILLIVALGLLSGCLSTGANLAIIGATAFVDFVVPIAEPSKPAKDCTDGSCDEEK